MINSDSHDEFDLEQLTAERDSEGADFARFRLTHLEVRRLSITLATYETPAEREIYLAGIFDRLAMHSKLEAILSVGSLLRLSIELTRVLDEMRAVSPECDRVATEIIRQLGWKAAADGE